MGLNPPHSPHAISPGVPASAVYLPTPLPATVHTVRDDRRRDAQELRTDVLEHDHKPRPRNRVGGARQRATGSSAVRPAGDGHGLML